MGMRETMLIYCHEMMGKYGLFCLMCLVAAFVASIMPIEMVEGYDWLAGFVRPVLVSCLLLSFLYYLIRFGFMLHGYISWKNRD